MENVIKGGQADRIKRLEMDLQNLRDVKSQKEKLVTDL